MSGNVYALIPLYHDKSYITLAYPCMFVFVFRYVFSLAMITFWWEQMRGRLEMDPGDTAVQLSFMAMRPFVLVALRATLLQDR